MQRFCSATCYHAARIGQHMPPDARAKIATAHRGTRHTFSPDGRERHLAMLKRRNDSAETRAKKGAYQRGKPPSPRALEALKRRNSGNTFALGLKRPQAWKDQQAGRIATRLASGRMPRAATAIERILTVFLVNAGFRVEPQRQFGRAVVDAYLPEYHLAFEADGVYWHNLPNRAEMDARRDARLLTDFGLPVVRLTEAELHAIDRQQSHLSRPQ